MSRSSSNEKSFQNQNEDNTKKEDQQSSTDSQNQQNQHNQAPAGVFKLNDTQVIIRPNIGKIDVKLFVGQISKSWTEKDLTTFFSKFGEILETQIIRDNKTGQHRGCAFVKFASLTKADEAVKNLVNVYLPGSNAPLQLRYADGEIERLGLAGIEEKQETKLFVGSIPKNATEQNLKDVFSQYGQIEDLHLMKDSDGSSKCCAFVKYVLKESALLAIKSLNAICYLQDSDKPIEVRFAEKKKTINQNNSGSGSSSNQNYNNYQKPQPQSQQFPQMQQQQQQMPFPNQPFCYEYMTQEGMCYYNPYTGQTQYQKPEGFTTVPYGMPPPYNYMMGGYGQYPYSNQFPGGQPGAVTGGSMQGGQQQININDLSQQSGSNQPKSQGPKKSNLFIFHLPNDWKESDLANQFQRFGRILSARIMTDRQTGRSKGYGFISYDNPQSANQAIRDMNGVAVNGKRLKVQLKKGEDEVGDDGMPTLANAKYNAY